MNQFYQKEIGGILGAILVSTAPVLAHHKEYKKDIQRLQHVLKNNIEKNMYLEQQNHLVI